MPTPSPPAVLQGTNSDRKLTPAPAAYLSANAVDSFSKQGILHEPKSQSSKSPSPPTSSIGSDPVKLDHAKQAAQTMPQTQTSASTAVGSASNPAAAKERYPARANLVSFPSSLSNSLPSTPTSSDTSSQPQSQRNSILSPSMSQRNQYAGFFHSDSDISPRSQRIRHGYGVEPSATPAMADPLQALSMSFGGGFYMPAERESLSSQDKRASQGSLSLALQNDQSESEHHSFTTYDAAFQDDSGYSTPFRSLRSSEKKNRFRQGSRALESDGGEDAEPNYENFMHSSQSSYRRMLPPSIHAPAPSQFLDGFDVEQYDFVKTPSPADIGFSTRIDEQLANANLGRMEDISRALDKLTDKVEALTYEQASQHREIQRQNRELDRQSSEIDRLRQLTYSLSRYSGMPPASSSSRQVQNYVDESRRSSLAISLASGISGASSQQGNHDRVESHRSYSQHAPQASIPSNNSSRNEAAHPYPPLHRSASQHVMHSKHQYPYEGTPSPASSVYGGNSPVHSLHAAPQYNANTPIPPNAMTPTPAHPSLPASQPGYPTVPPRHVASGMSDASARARAHTTSAYHPSSSSSAGPPAASSNSSPFYSLAAASGVVLPEHGQHQSQVNGQPNYRHLMQDTAIVDYRNIIRLLLDRNDQQASIFLQQKLKNCNDPIRRSDIIENVLPFAFELITNRFGNFIVSRCLDVGDERQRSIIAGTMQGRISSLACDTYGSHVVQKAIDLIEGFDSIVVSELSRNAKTLVNKSAGHVWSKLLSSSSPPVNLYPSLKNSISDWSQVAQDETGSLLCQAILENWPQGEKEDIVKSLIRDTLELCGSQWATFVVLHLIEHGRDEDREQIFAILLKACINISQDQFGAKAIEKMIKVAGMSSQVTKDYVKQICDATRGRPAVVTICQNANGSQIVTLLLTNAPGELKEMLIEAIRRHGVTLKGSKHGSRIWFVVERARAWRGH